MDLTCLNGLESTAAERWRQNALWWQSAAIFATLLAVIEAVALAWLLWKGGAL